MSIKGKPRDLLKSNMLSLPQIDGGGIGVNIFRDMPKTVGPNSARP